MFAASTDLLLIRSEDRVALYDVVQEKPTPYEAKIPHVKDAIWSRPGTGSSPPLVAFICRTGVVRTKFTDLNFPFLTTFCR